MQKEVHHFTFKPHINVYGSILHNHRFSKTDRIANQLGSIRNLEFNLTSISSLLWNLFSSNLYITSSLVFHPCPVCLHKYQISGYGEKMWKPFMCSEYPRINPSKCVWRAGERATRVYLPKRPECNGVLEQAHSSSQEPILGTSLAVQWLRLRAPNAGGVGLIPGRGTKIPHATLCGCKNKTKKEPILFLPSLLYVQWHHIGSFKSTIVEARMIPIFLS